MQFWCMGNGRTSIILQELTNIQSPIKDGQVVMCSCCDKSNTAKHSRLAIEIHHYGCHDISDRATPKHIVGDLVVMVKATKV